MSGFLSPNDEEISVDEMDNMYLNFVVGKETYAIEIRYVLQIIGMQEINEMPDMEHGMKGYINLRGSVIPIYSMHVRFNKEEPFYDERTCIIVVTVNGKQLGLVVDAIREVTTIEDAQVSPPPGVNEYANSPVRGVAQLGVDRSVVLLELKGLFN